jgi:hypothetical protein
VPRARELLAGALLAAVGVLFALGMLELGVRWMHLVPDRFWEPDPLLGVRLIPGHQGWWTQEDREFLVPVQINHEGLRDVEHPYAKSAGVFRILVLGDSFVEAMHVPLASTFTRQLEQQLNAAGTQPRVEVVAAGVSGYGTASELLYFEREGQRYQPDLVLLAFYPGNDVKNNSPTLEDTLRPVYANDGTLQKVIGEKRERTVSGWRGWFARSAAYHYFRQVLLLRHPELARTLVRHGWLKGEAVSTAPEREGVPVDYGVYGSSLPSEWQEAWGHTEWLLNQLRQAATGAGARFAVAVLGTRDQVYPDWWQEIVSAHPKMQGREWNLDGPQRRMEAWCAQHDVPCVSMASAFRAAASRDDERLHFHRDGHWTVAGHHLAAHVLTDFLEQHQLVPSRQPQGVRNEVH